MRNRVFSGWLMAVAWSLSVLLFLAALAGCSPTAAIPTATVPAAEPTAATATQKPLPTHTQPPTATATAEPSATSAPSATPTQPPTETLLPALAVLPDSFNVWCAPREYAGAQIDGPDAPVYANQMVRQGDALQVKIPASVCAVAFRFNQPVPTGAKLVVYDGSSPFINVPLAAVEGRPDEAWAILKHDYVVNPPYWEITYRVAVTSPDGEELWSVPMTFARPLPDACPFGGLPNPVTLYCMQTDPKELEPKPGVTIPPYYTIVPSED